MEPDGWRLYYADGSTVDSTQMNWEDAPRESVQVLIVFHSEKDKYSRPLREMYHGSPGNAGDYYWQFGAGTANDVPDDAAVKYGSMMERKEEWLALYSRALNDYEWH